jgi:hypothetical protein
MNTLKHLFKKPISFSSPSHFSHFSPTFTFRHSLSYSTSTHSNSTPLTHSTTTHSTQSFSTSALENTIQQSPIITPCIPINTSNTTPLSNTTIQSLQTLSHQPNHYAILEIKNRPYHVQVNDLVFTMHLKNLKLGTSPLIHP